MREINGQGRALIETFEQLRLMAYLDERGIPTIGYGHTGPEVHLGQTCTALDAHGWLEQDLSEAEEAISGALHVPVTDNEFAALVSLAFNAGATRVANSTLMRLLNAGNRLAAAKEFARWDHEGVKESAGLLRRRFAEASLFLTPSGART